MAVEVTSPVLASPWLRTPLVVVVALSIQTTLLADVRPFGAHADVLLLLSIGAGLVAGSQVGVLTGFLTGLAYDLLLQTPFGLSALTYGVAGYVAGYFTLNAAVAPWYIVMGLVAALSAAAIVFYAVVGTVFGLQGAIVLHLIVVILVVSIVNGLLAPPALWVQRWALHVERD
jgi:rod shape-determining protein MreD